jgi:hypothetical protein
VEIPFPKQAMMVVVGLGFSVLPDKFRDSILIHAITAFPNIHSILLLTVPTLHALLRELP